jgi:hypothetical protein
MDSETLKIIEALHSIKSVEDESDLDRLDDTLQQVAIQSNKEEFIAALFNIFERFPEKDAYGVFWSILHLLESIPGYETKLIESVKRQPSEFSLRMINRMLNSDIEEVPGVKLFSVLEQVAGNPTLSESIKKEAQRFVEFQKTKQDSSQPLETD